MIHSKPHRRRRPGARPLPLQLPGLLLALIPILAPPAASGASRDEASGWIKLTTPHFELYSNARESDARRVLEDLATYRNVVSRFLGLTNVHRRPAPVFFFKDESSFTPYKPRYNGRPRGVSGFHVEDPMDTALAFARQPRGSVTSRVVYHEYTHLLTVRQFRAAPIWAHEGVAEVFSTFEHDADRYDIGVALTNHVFFLLKHRPMPVRDLLHISSASAEYNDSEYAGSFYATSWLLAHHLLFARRGFETNVMGRYADISHTTTNLVEAFTRAFGRTPEQADAELQRYLQGGNYTIVRQTFPGASDVSPVRARLAPGELDYALGRLLQMVQQTEPARQRLTDAARKAPDDPRPREALALLAWRLRDRDQITENVAEALRLGSQEPFLHFIAAESHFQNLSRERLAPEMHRRGLEFGRSLCLKALELDRELAPAHHLLGVYVLGLNPTTPALAAVHVKEALRWDPEYKPALLTLASLYAAQGEPEPARRILERLLAGPANPDIHEHARSVLAEINKRFPTP